MGKFIDLSGKRFGFWVVVKYDNKNKNGQTQWLCKCECGAEKTVTSNSLRTGNSTSCGCNRTVNLVDKQFGNLIVKEADYSKGRRYWLCQCDCGNHIITSAYKLKGKFITSCGCKKKPKYKEEKIKNLIKHSIKLQKRLEDFSNYAKKAHESFIKLRAECTY